MLHTACPDAQVLSSFRLGRLVEKDAESVLKHLAECASCVQTLESIKVGDTLVDVLHRAAETVQQPMSPEVDSLIERFCKLPRGGEVTQAEKSAADTPSASATGTAAEVGSEAWDFLAPAQAADELGRLGHYRVLKVLGAGGMGAVFLAEDISLKRHVALKTMQPALAASKSARDRFLREAQSAAAIKHDHIVTIYQVSEDRGVPYLAMELLEGEPLDKRLHREGMLSTEETLRIGKEIARGLAAAHRRGLLHRDIKPANIWLESVVSSQWSVAEDKAATPPATDYGLRTTDSRVKIVDFGLARAVDQESHLTQQGAIVGTPAFMAPEQGRGDKVDHRTDLFSLGCVMYRMATGKNPFKGKDTVSTLMSVALDNPPPPCEVNPKVPQALSDLVMKLLAKAPQDRPASAQLVAEQLERIGGEFAVVVDKRVPSTEYSVLSPSAPAGDTPVGATLSLPPAPERQKVQSTEYSVLSTLASRRRLLVAAAILLGIAGAGWYLAQIIIRVPSEHGTLVVEFDDKTLVAEVGRNVITFSDLTNKKKQFELAPGPGKVIFRDALGNELYSEDFVLKKGGVETVRANMEKIEAARKTPTATDPDRSVAVWVLQRGGHVDVIGVGAVKQVADIPKTPFSISAVGLSGVKPRILDEDLVRLQALSKLHNLELDFNNTGDAGVEHLLRIPSLRGVFLSDSTISEKGLSKLAQLPLQALSVSSPLLVADDARHIRQMKNLTYLRILGAWVTDKALEHLKGMSLETLVIIQTDVTNEGLANLAGLPQLNTLTINLNKKVTAQGLKHVKILPGLQDLNLNGLRLSDDDLKSLAVHKKLTKLQIRDSNVTVAAVKALQADLPKCQIQSDYGTFDPPTPVADTPGSPDSGRAAIAQLLRAGGEIRLWTGDNHGPILHSLADVPANARVSAIHFYKNADKAGPAEIAAALDALNAVSAARVVHMDHFVFGTSWPLTDKDLARLLQMPALKGTMNLHLYDTRVTDKGLAYLPAWPNLTMIHVGNANVGDDGLAYVAKLRKLDALDLPGTRVTAKGLAQVTALKLRGLNLRGCQGLDDEAVIPLCQIKTLESINVKGTKLTSNGIARIRAAFPNCRIQSDHGTFGPQTPLADADRRAAEWVFKVGGQITIKTGSNIRSVITRPDSLPPTFVVEVINLSGKPVSDTELKQLHSLAGLVEVNLKGTQVSKSGVAELVTALPQCKIESAYGTFLPDYNQRAAEVVESLGGKLRRDFSIATKPILEINLLRSKVRDADLEHFSKLNHLEMLTLGDTRITDQGLAHLQGLTNLRNLDLGTTDVTDAGFVHLKGLTNLRRLELFRTTVGDKGLANLSGMTELGVLGLEGTRVGDAGLAHLKGMTKLHALNLSGTNVTDTGLDHLRGTNIRELHVQGTAVTAAAKQRLLQAISTSPRPAPKTPVADAPGSPKSAFKNTLGMEFALIPKGKALLGGTGGKIGSEQVEFKQDFYLGVYEVTQEDWQKVMGTNPSQFTPKGKQSKLVKETSGDDLKRFPVESVSWDDAQEFVARLNEKCKEQGWVYRLPTEKEWQYACRGGQGLKKEDYGFDYYFDRPTNTLLPDRANFNANVGRPMKVGSFPPNKLGLYDMHGNVAEWCDDLLPNPQKGYNRLFRGGSWRHEASWCRATFQMRSPNFAKFDDVGLRLARVKAPGADGTPTAESTRYLGHKQKVHCVSFSADGKRFISGSFGQLWLWEVGKPQEIRQFPVQGWAYAAAISPNGRYVVSGEQAGIVRLWHAETASELGRWNIAGIFDSAAFAPDSEHFLIGGESSGLRWINVQTKKEIRRFPGRVGCLSEDGKTILSGENQSLHLSNVETEAELKMMAGKTVGIASLAWSSKAGRALTASGDKREKAPWLWDLKSGQQRALTGHTSTVYAVAISPDGRRGLSASDDKTVRLWNLETGNEIATFSGHTEGVTCVAFSADGQYALSGSWDKSVRLWKLPK